MSKSFKLAIPIASLLVSVHGTAAYAENGIVELRMATSLTSNTDKHGLDRVTTSTTQNRNLDVLTKKPSSETMPRWIAVSLKDQSLKLYQGLEVIEHSNISSGKSGHATPTGIFSILGKKKFHKSNIYSNAPMPFMQRLTWSGIALHESNSVPSYPASHGCVRLPNGFAKKLFGQTKHGIHVIISPEEVVPKWVSHPSLFQSNKSDINLAALRTSIADYDGDADDKLKTSKAKPLRIYVTRATKWDEVFYVQSQLYDLGYTFSEPDGLYGKMSIAAVKRFQSANSLKRTGTITDELLDTLKVQSGSKIVPKAKLFIRRDKQPIYETQITLSDPQKPLGSHLLMMSENSSGEANWFSISMSSKIPNHIIRDHGLEKAYRNTRVFANVNETLDRIVLPDDARTFIEARLEGGASFAISDNGIGTETGDGTDFIVQTH